MDLNKYNVISLRETNLRTIKNNQECQKAIKEMKDIERFLSDFGVLLSGRDFVLCDKHTFSLHDIFTGCELTIGSIISCCESGCMADAYTLLRKYLDDLFFYLYVITYNVNKKFSSDLESKKDKEMKRNIDNWVENKLSDLYIGQVLSAIGRSAQAKDAVIKYKLKDAFDEIGDKLNNYVHSNGISFYNERVFLLSNDVLKQSMDALLHDMRYITTTFLFLLTLCYPASIMSTDYIDSLDFGTDTSEGSQYWIAPFVYDFFKSNLDLIDKSCVDYLRDNTSMIFD